MTKKDIIKYTFITTRDKDGRLMYRTEVKCPICKKIRWVRRANIKNSKNWTGRCQSCNGKYYSGDKNWHWKDGKMKLKSGYIMIKLQPDHKFASMCNHKGYVYEHRLVMAQKLNRVLTSLEPVHHLNGIKGDNRPENLELVGAGEHNLITKLQTRIRELEAQL